mmetsp:Transcript_75511/g.179362  ORF Transcript_75511/g.179362 Transcript_75511/m.179362 type:complete len:375 (-) Transcript_75511:175-1299(-)|eukprot:CAMPEP_0178425942 /NCGR_PEP_ID=MMETSP0689_2-20121128/28981_1 /TAXON_ID=160604 /ORGANISM="Amphidinium massartii, Strain CS-259" /LENGTH=374 /DNA_ID=CAMNT_0020047617 /DNA_START=100 /DNA_END=1224 /DNA_ORIENTATION=-
MDLGGAKQSPRRQFGPSRSLVKPQQKASVLDFSSANASPRRRKEVAEYSWAHVHMRYLPNEAREEAEAAILQAQSEAAAARAELHELQKIDVDKILREVEEDAERRIKEVQHTAVQKSIAYEERIRSLERLIEFERAEHQKQIKDCMDGLQRLEQEAQQHIQEARQECAKEVAAAKVREAQGLAEAEAANQRTQQLVQSLRANEQDRVREIRGMADAHLHSMRAQMTRELQETQEDVARRLKQAQEGTSAQNLQKEEAIKDAHRHLVALEDEARAVRALQEVELAKREVWFEQQTAAHRRHKDMVETHHKTLLDLEKGLHQRTMERTMLRITRHLQYGDAEAAGEDTPTRKVFRQVKPKLESPRQQQLLQQSGK